MSETPADCSQTCSRARDHGLAWNPSVEADGRGVQAAGSHFGVNVADRELLGGHGKQRDVTVASHAVGGDASNVTIKYLTVQNFATPQDQGTINHDMGTGWTVSNITAEHNNAAAVMVGPNGVLRDSCLTLNGQYGFQGAAQQTDSNILVTHNEISDNNTNNTEALDPDCGCSGGSKFWDFARASQW